MLAETALEMSGKYTACFDTITLLCKMQFLLQKLKLSKRRRKCYNGNAAFTA